MRRLPPFSVTRPVRLEEACARIEESAGAAAAYAGGTELLLAMKLGLLAYTELVDIKGLTEMRGIDDGTEMVRIGAATTHRELERDPVIGRHLPMLRVMASGIANPRVRTSGTVGGNLAFAEPRSDVATALLVHDAEVEIASTRGTRRVPVAALLLGAFEPALEPGELLVAVHVPVADDGWSGSYLRYQLYERPTLGVAVRLRRTADGKSIAEARLALGCVEPIPRRHLGIEEALAGPVGDVLGSLPNLSERLAGSLEATDDDDASADYKRHLAAVYFRRAVEVAATSK